MNRPELLRQRGEVLRWALCGALLLTAGCKGCGDGDAVVAKPSPAVGNGPTQRELLDKRLAMLKLDRSVAQTRDAQGRVACGDSATCFVVAAERCEAAVLVHRLSTTNYGLRQDIETQYEIFGLGGGHCRMSRQPRSFAVVMEPAMVELLTSRGKTPEEIEAVRLEAETRMGHLNPPEMRCDFAALDALEVAVSLAEGRHAPRPWRGRCVQVPDSEMAK